METKCESLASSESDDSPKKLELKKSKTIGSSLFLAADRKNTLSTFLPQARSGNMSIFDPGRNSLSRGSIQGSAYQSTFSISNLKVKSSNLPEHFDVKSVKKNYHDSETCQLCDKKFTLFIKKKNCNRCSRCICSDCGDNRRVLSLSDKKKYRVCDRCDFKLENSDFENKYKSILKAESDTISIQNSIIQKLTKELDEDVYIPDNTVEREQEKNEFDEKFNNDLETLQFINRNHTFYQKNLINANKRITDLDRNIENLKVKKKTSIEERKEMELKCKKKLETLKEKHPNYEQFIKDLLQNLESEDPAIGEVENLTPPVLDTDALNAVRKSLERQNKAVEFLNAPGQISAKEAQSINFDEEDSQ
ncbi:unnamed protein product [Moneuplotes crassus]|uniref:FYVE-type domain-containing protein n=1 Tax=Euplotes crassus TaxID=5936 RepID=A0AAD1XAY6_EUPCR|nr:unnamed protein product [Moneuplotes crassus]